MAHETVSHTGADGGPEGSVERTVDGVTVRKSFETDAFPVPAVEFDIRSTRDHSVEVTIVDDVPQEIDMEQVGFHPQYHSDQWTPYPEGRVEFEHEVPPGGAVTTIYGVRLDGTDPDTFLQHPRISVGGYDLDEPILRDVDDTEEDSEESAVESAPVETEPPISIPEGDPSEVVREVVGSEPDTLASVDSGHPPDEGKLRDPQVSESGEDETSELTQVVRRVDEETDEEQSRENSDAAPTAKATDGSGAMVEQAPAQRMDGSKLLSELADAVREDRVPEEDLDVLESAFGTSASQDSRVSHLQSRVSDLEAYTDALEEFIDQNGTAQQIFEDVENDVVVLKDRLDTVETSIEEGAAERAVLDEGLTDATDRLATVEDGFDDIDGRISSLTHDIARIDRAHEELEASMAELEALEDEMDRLKDEMEDEVTNLSASVESVREKAETAMSDLQSTQGDVEDLRTWRDELTTVLGAGSSED